MSGYAFHPDAFADLDEILEYVAQDNIDAADRVLADIHTVLRTLAATTAHRASTPRFDSRAIAIPCRAPRVSRRLCTRRETALRRRRSSWAPESAADGSDPSRPTVDRWCAERRVLAGSEAAAPRLRETR